MPVTGNLRLAKVVEEHLLRKGHASVIYDVMQVKRLLHLADRVFADTVNP